MVDYAKNISSEKMDTLLNRFLLFINPKPDISLLLELNPESAYNRKKEENIVELKKSIDLYNQLGEMKEFIKVDSTLLFQEVSQEISNKVISQYYNQ